MQELSWRAVVYIKITDSVIPFIQNSIISDVSHDLQYSNIPSFLTYIMTSFILWILLLIFCWPLALAALIVYPIIWLVLLPFRLLGIVVEGVFETLRAIILLPARVLRRA